MKKIIIFFNVILACILVGCEKNDITREKVDDDCLVTINPIGEISTSESPMTKTSSSNNDIYLIQVYIGASSYAMGYFDNLASMALSLKQGSSYTVYITMIKDAKTLLRSRYNVNQNSINNYKSDEDTFDFSFYPYDYYIGHKYNSGGGVNSSKRSYYNTKNTSTTGESQTYISGWNYPLNCYQYNFNNKLLYYDGSTANVLSEKLLTSNGIKFLNIAKGVINDKKYPECKDWLYGEATITPKSRHETLNIDLRRTGFKLKYELSGVTDGSVYVRIYNKDNNRTFFDNVTKINSYTSDERFFAFYDVSKAWQYAEDYSEHVVVNVEWTRGTGLTQDLGEKSVLVKRNCLNNIKIALGSDDKGAGINMTTETDDWSENANTDITVQ